MVPEAYGHPSVALHAVSYHSIEIVADAPAYRLDFWRGMATVLLVAFRSIGPEQARSSLKPDTQTVEEGSSHGCTLRRTPPGKGHLGMPIGGGEDRPLLALPVAPVNIWAPYAFNWTSS